MIKGEIPMPQPVFVAGAHTLIGKLSGFRKLIDGEVDEGIGQRAMNKDAAAAVPGTGTTGSAIARNQPPAPDIALSSGHPGPDDTR
jgi:hypothetical protein